MPHPLTLLFCIAGLTGAVVGQGLGKTGSEALCTLYPTRAKTFIKASYDPEDLATAPNGGNDDGFSGQNLCEAYRYRSGNTNVAVLTDQQGRAGFMGLFFRNFWSDWLGTSLLSGESNRVQMFLDGRLAHDLPLPHFFRNTDDPRGQVSPFDGPFTGNRSGGHLTHAPLIWSDSFRVEVVDDSFSNAARFHKVAGSLDTPERQLRVPDRREWERIANLKGTWPHSSTRVPVVNRFTLASGAIASVGLRGPAVLLELNCRASPREGWQGLRARFTWDGAVEPAVDIPLRMLGAMVEPPFRFALRDLMLGNNGSDTITCYFPMPFKRRGILEVINENNFNVSLEIRHALEPGVPVDPWGYFHATWQSGTTATGVAFRGPRMRGRGMLRYLALETGMDDTGRIPDMHLTHLEGDLCVRINGNRGDEHSFAASETSIGKWGWYLSPADRAFVSQGSYQSGLLLRQAPAGHRESKRIMGSTFVFDPIHFVDGFEMVLEHGVQNTSNADYGLAAFFYIQPEAARYLVTEVDVGDQASEAEADVAFSQRRRYVVNGGFPRDQFFGTGPVTDVVRQIRNFYRFRVTHDGLPPGGFGIGVRLDRLSNGLGGLCQAEVYVDNVYAGLIHCYRHSPVFPWMEGGELEMEIPIGLTDEKTTFVVELRPRSHTDPFQLARVWVYGYRR